MYNCHFNGPVCFLMIFMQQIIIRVLFIYHGKDIDLNTGSFLPSWVRPILGGVSVSPSAKWWNVTIQTLQIEYLGDT